MTSNTDWSRILLDCRDNIIEALHPLLDTLDAPHPDLGRGAGGDLIKPVDLAAEKAIIETLQESDISFTLISEESGVVEYGGNPKQFYITVDPIDGTTNLVRGIPFYCTSIAVSSMPTISAVQAALVTDLFHSITYVAQKGQGAFRDKEQIAPSKIMGLEDALVGLDMNTYKVKEIAPRITNLIQKTKHIRHFGANALEICYVADATTDVFIDIRGKLRTTDVAAAFLVVKEAGGIITTPEGVELDAYLDPKTKLAFIAAGNPQIHKLVLSLLTS